MNLVNLDIKPENIFVGVTEGNSNFDNMIVMDLGTSIVLSPNEDGEDRYLVSFASKEFCSP